VAAIVVGVVVALIFASIIIIPIKRLVQGVELIRDTEDKEDLKSHKIQVKSKDEISTLADTVNQMTTGLVKAAVANKELIVGKEVQKMFIPLDIGTTGGKGTTGKLYTDNIAFFGYYEGAKGVSGDYFDFQQLDDKHYAIIKCDVAGKGVPASLIMVEVATIFLNYFRDWTLQSKGIELDKLVYSMNDLLEERGFKGRFAALIIVILNVETGACYMCNAGDNIVHIYDSTSGHMFEKILPESPATGVFPSMLVEMQSGFQQIPHQVKPGDTLFLFTDGIEEAQRLFRDSTFQPIVCDQTGLSEGELHGNHMPGSGFEELGIPRIEEIIDAVFNRGTYTLEKYHNPVPEEKLTFNFSSCSGKVEEAVLALISVEKMFRIYPDPAATAEDKVAVDRNVDQFLRDHFEQFHLYFEHPMEQDEESDYVRYSHLKEEEQFDDLTILGVKKL
jgi:serine phosphatase RsbU (regulator of sigma subunit)